jgi:GT2 family glycosyltransferase
MTEEHGHAAVSRDCTASMVIYMNPPAVVREAAASFLNTDCSVTLHIVDNSPKDELRSAFDGLPVVYHFTNENIGYGMAHNRIIFGTEPSRYHLALNPDILIPAAAIRILVRFMDSHPDVGMVCPRVLNEDGTDQYLNKRYPSVMDLFVRRFAPRILHPLLKRRLDRYEMRDVGYDKVCDVEVMSGAFMLCRTTVLKKVAGFDPRFFLYFEDFDLSRKFQQDGFRTVYCPEASVTHYWTRGAHKNIRMTVIFMASMYRYFDKWGWKWL